MDIKKRFNVSYSAYSLYKQSPLQFYFQYIAKATPTNKAYQVYGDAGNVVHKAIEGWLKNSAFSNRDFEALWLDAEIDNKFGMNGTKLSFARYVQMFDQAKFVVRQFNLMAKNIAVEKETKFQEYGMTIKGIVDLQIVEENGDIILYDWKTDSAHTQDKHHTQRLFYSWMYYIATTQIPMCRWVYLATNDFVEEKFTLSDIERFDKELETFIIEIEQKGDDISKYESGDWKGPFNVYANLCADEIARRNSQESIFIRFVNKGNFIFVENAPDKLLEGIDLATKFDLPDKYFMQEAVRKKARGKVNLSDIGTVHLFNTIHKCFPIGLRPKIIELVAEYADYYKQSIQIEYIDNRDHVILNQKIDYYIKNAVLLRDYQVKAIREFLNKEMGIIQIPTGGGKTITAVNILDWCKARTLWLCDRKELLTQTKDVLQHHFGEKVYEFNSKTNEKDNVQPIIISTVQFICSLIKKDTELMAEFLGLFNMVVIDEYHKSAADSYQKILAKMPHTKYRLGLTATPTRDDGKTPILYSQIGEVIFKISEEELMSQGYLVRPTIVFKKVEGHEFSVSKKKYTDDYNDSIVNNWSRHEDILTIIGNNVNKKILVLTKSIEHAAILSSKIQNIPVAHIQGKSPKESREAIMRLFKTRTDGMVLFITLSIGAEGLDIPDLDIVINASGNKGDVKSQQVLGRVLRTFENKKEAIYYDFIDCGYHTYNHSIQRKKLFESKGYKIITL